MQSLRANMIQMTRVTGSGAKAHTERLLLGVYVDDLAVAYKESGKGSLYHDFTLALRRWQVEDEGELYMISLVLSSPARKVVQDLGSRLSPVRHRLLSQCNPRTQHMWLSARIALEAVPMAS